MSILWRARRALIRLLSAERQAFAGQHQSRGSVGNFYTNITLRSGDTDRIVKSLTEVRRTALVAPPSDGFSVVYDEASEEQDPQVIDEVVSHVSSRLGCAALVVVNHDDDFLWFGLYERRSEEH